MSDHDKTAPGAPGATRGPEVDYSDSNVTLDAAEDRWAWRARLRRNRVTHLVWRTAVGVVGAVVTVAGLIMVPAPGPGWLVVFFGLLILASEFEFAQGWLDFGKHHVSRWNDWIMDQAIWVRGLVALCTLLIVWAVIWAYLALAGIPQIVPQWGEDLLARLPGID
ncbi:TIGR02611 family protein [Terrabacter sp. MAHUQ-38]|uniref:TIGR02611 family protein n=1 Tax=unclassified Terrabacter TaxID=2630222 RepID=UPI00165DEC2C|nr:TIGR02611 family protein [Terrabacter sp. MAHUQ-38]